MFERLQLKKKSLLQVAKRLLLSTCFLLVSIREAEPDDFKKKNALEWHQAEVEKNPNDKAAWFTMGTFLAKTGKYEDAIKAFDRVTWLDPLHIRAWDAKAKAFFRLEKYEEALDCFERALELDRRDERLWFHRGETLLKLNKQKQALNSFDRALEIDPNFAEAWYGRGQALREIEDHPALPKEEQAVVSQGKAPEGKEQHGKDVRSSSSGKSGHSNVLGKDIDLPLETLDYKNKQDCLLAANIQRYAGNTEKALELYDKAIRMDPEFLDAWYLKGTLLYILDRHKDAVECFNRVLALDPSHVWAKKRKAEVEAMLADVSRKPIPIQTQEEKIDKLPKEPSVVKAFTESLSRISEMENLLEKANQSYIAGEYEVAIAYYDNVLDMDRKNHRAWKGKGEVLAAMGRHEEATECFERASKLNPKDVTVWHNEGKLLHSHGKKAEALAALGKATKLDPELAEAWYESGTILNALGKSVKAHRALQEAFNLYFLRTLKKHPNEGEDDQDRRPLLEKAVEPEPKRVPVAKGTKKLTVSREDRNILICLWDRAKAVPQIAKQSGIPIAECYRRVKKLYSLGVLERIEFRDVLNPEKKVNMYKLISKEATIFVREGKVMIEIVMPAKKEADFLGRSHSTVE